MPPSSRPRRRRSSRRCTRSPASARLLLVAGRHGGDIVAAGLGDVEDLPAGFGNGAAEALRAAGAAAVEQLAELGVEATSSSASEFERDVIIQVAQRADAEGPDRSDVTTLVAHRRVTSGSTLREVATNTALDAGIMDPRVRTDDGSVREISTVDEGDALRWVFSGALAPRCGHIGGACGRRCRYRRHAGVHAHGPHRHAQRHDCMCNESPPPPSSRDLAARRWWQRRASCPARPGPPPRPARPAGGGAGSRMGVAPRWARPGTRAGPRGVVRAGRWRHRHERVPTVTDRNSRPWVIAAGVYDGDGPDLHLLSGPTPTQLRVLRPRRLRRILDFRSGLVAEVAPTARGPIETVRFSSMCCRAPSSSGSPPMQRSTLPRHCHHPRTARCWTMAGSGRSSGCGSRQPRGASPPPPP